MTTTRKRAPRGRAAVNAWPDRLAAVRQDPSDANLQSLCTLLDAVDSWTVEAHGTPAHVDRVGTLLACRRDAREANRLVTERLRQGQSEAGRVKAANRRSGRRTTGSAGLDGPGPGDAS